LDELPEPNVEVTEAQGSGFGGGFGGYGGYGSSRFDAATSFGSSYNTPGWQRAQAKKNGDGFAEPDTDYDAGDDTSFPLPRAGEGRSSAARSGGGSRNPSASEDDTSSPSPSPWRARDERVPRPRLPLTIEGELVAKSTGTVSAFTLGDRVFHQKFGNGNVTAIDGNKLTIQFDRAGEKRVVDSFVERV
jgi:DNA helicase-2/ATP-dependent DNA helicase PcrA